MPILATLLPVVVLIGGGALFGRLRGIGPGGVAALSAFTVWLALPALLFRSLAGGNGPASPGTGFLLAFAGGMTGTLMAALALAPRIGGRPAPLADRALFGLTAAYANTAFIGVPVAGGLFGAAGLAAAVAASILTVSILFAAAVLLVEVGRHGRDAVRALPRTGAAVLGNPLVASPLAGALWRLTGLVLPLPAARTLDLLAAAASPCALVAIGASLALPRDAAGTVQAATMRAATARAVALKLALQPALTAFLAFVVLPTLGVPVPAPRGAAAVVIAALPTGTGPFMLTALYARDDATAARAILLSTLSAIVTVPAIALLLAAWG